MPHYINTRIDPNSPVTPTEPGSYIGCIQIEDLNENGWTYRVTVNKKVSGPETFPQLSVEEIAKILAPRLVHMKAFQEGYACFTDASIPIEKLTPVQLEGYLAAKADVEQYLIDLEKSKKGEY